MIMWTDQKESHGNVRSIPTPPTPKMQSQLKEKPQGILYKQITNLPYADE